MPGSGSSGGSEANDSQCPPRLMRRFATRGMDGVSIQLFDEQLLCKAFVKACEVSQFDPSPLARLSGSTCPGVYQIDDLLEYIRLTPEDPVRSQSSKTRCRYSQSSAISAPRAVSVPYQRNRAGPLKDTADSAPYAGPEHNAYIRQAQLDGASD